MCAFYELTYESVKKNTNIIKRYENQRVLTDIHISMSYANPFF